MTDQQRIETKTARKKLVTSRSVFSVTILVLVLTLLGVWLFGLGQHRTLFVNSLLSTSILSLAFFLFLSIGLYHGIKLKDNLGKITDQIKVDKLPDFSSGFDMSSGILEFGDGFAEFLLGVLVWILFSIFLFVIIWFFGALVWTMILVFMAMLYWIFFRALRLVFKNSNKCKGNLAQSMAYGIGYTVVYNFWIYGIILVTHYLLNG